MNFQQLTANKVLDILRDKYTLENNQFADQIRIVIQQLESSGPKVITRGTQASQFCILNKVQIAKQTIEMSSSDIILPSKAVWVSPVKKANKSIRILLDLLIVP